MNFQSVFDKIVSLIHPADLVGLTDHEIIQGWQATHGLKPDGVLGQVTSRLADTPRICGVRDRLSVGGATKFRWDTTKYLGNGQWQGGTPEVLQLYYYISGSSSTLTLQQVQAAVAEAFSSYRRVCAVEAVPLQSATGANLVIDFGDIDGPSKVLAYCELPAGRETPTTTLKMMVDQAEPWIISANPSGNYIDMVRVVRHEGGHWLGLDHLAAGNLMAPYYDRSIRDLQAGDISELVLRYGVMPITPTTPPAQPPANPSTKATVEIRLGTGQTYHFEGQPV